EYLNEMGSCCGTNFVTKHWDGRDVLTEHDYDAALDRIKTTIHAPEGSGKYSDIVTEFEYYTNGQLKAIIHPPNDTGHHRRDEFIYYPSGDSQEGYLHQKKIDAASAQPLVTTYAYDPVGNVVSVTDPRGNDTIFEVNSLNQVILETSRPMAAGGTGYRKYFWYDANDNVIKIELENIDDQGLVVAANPWFTTVFQYDILNSLRFKTEEVGAGEPDVVTEYQYD